MSPKPLKDDLRKRTADDLRNERDQLGGWIRQPEVRWLDPSILAKAGVEVAVSGTFGKFADKREIQTASQGPFEYALADGELWIDYLSDTGDGWAATQTMAWVCAQPSLTVGGEALPRGRVLLLGGDQVYPTAGAEAYEDRFKGPFAAALPSSTSGQEPDMFATPGNHDWYDGLVSFLRLFCAKGWIGGWRTRQRRSYFALKLPNGWWIWAIDIQLDTYIDDVQLQYFADHKIGPGDKIVLLTAKPSWIAAVDGRVEPATWRFLNFFEERMVRDTGAKLALTITGDRHHYARYEPSGAGAEDAPTRLTAGGGGAYLSGTHTLERRLLLQTLPRKGPGDTYVDRPPVVNSLEEMYPSDKDSRRLSNGILKLAALNPAFGGLVGVLYSLIAFALLGATDLAANPVRLTGPAGSIRVRLYDDTIHQGYWGFLSGATGAGLIVVALVLLGALYVGTDLKPGGGLSSLAATIGRGAIALAQTLVHVLVASLVAWAAVRLAPHVWDSRFFIWLVAIAAGFVAGQLIGTTIFAFFLWALHKVRGAKAQAAANQVFTGQSIADYKNMLKLRFGADGGLTIYSLGVDKACGAWELAEQKPAPRFEPRAAKPDVHPIDRTLRFDAHGNPVA